MVRFDDEARQDNLHSGLLAERGIPAWGLKANESDSYSFHGKLRHYFPRTANPKPRAAD